MSIYKTTDTTYKGADRQDLIEESKLLALSLSKQHSDVDELKEVISTMIHDAYNLLEESQLTDGFENVDDNLIENIRMLEISFSHIRSTIIPQKCGLKVDSFAEERINAYADGKKPILIKKEGRIDASKPSIAGLAIINKRRFTIIAKEKNEGMNSDHTSTAKTPVSLNRTRSV